MSQTLLVAMFGLLAFSCSKPAKNTNEVVTKKAPKEAIRGVWITNVASEVLLSKDNIEEAVALLDSLGFNTIFMVTWNRGYTIYPSAAAKSVTSFEIAPIYDGRDPLKEMIEAAHATGMKVFAWFEFGFASSYGEADGGHILRKKPEWISHDTQRRHYL